MPCRSYAVRYLHALFPDALRTGGRRCGVRGSTIVAARDHAYAPPPLLRRVWCGCGGEMDDRPWPLDIVPKLTTGWPTTAYRPLLHLAAVCSSNFRLYALSASALPSLTSFLSSFRYLHRLRFSLAPTDPHITAPDLRALPSELPRLFVRACHEKHRLRDICALAVRQLPISALPQLRERHRPCSTRGKARWRRPSATANPHPPGTLRGRGGVGKCCRDSRR
ncbi:hypothetical protein B0H12DRAFT_444646 [Mycena haematopus]|nr:hypothetical protein B0H12DRAFT_444646 [Mycena haematopus]